MIHCFRCGSPVIQARYSTLSSTLCDPCKEDWREEEAEADRAYRDREHDDDESAEEKFAK